MALDETLRRQLVEGREKIRAQMDEIWYVSQHLGFTHFGGGSPNYPRLYRELEAELREINKLLGLDENDGVPE